MTLWTYWTFCCSVFYLFHSLYALGFCTIIWRRPSAFGFIRSSSLVSFGHWLIFVLDVTASRVSSCDWWRDQVDILAWATFLSLVPSFLWGWRWHDLLECTRLDLTTILTSKRNMSIFSYYLNVRWHMLPIRCITFSLATGGTCFRCGCIMTHNTNCHVH